MVLYDMIGYIVWLGNIEIGFVSISARFLNVSRVIFVLYIYIYIFLCILVYIVSLKNHFEKILWEKKIFKVSEFSTRNTGIFRGDNFFAICRQYDNNGENKIGIIFVLLVLPPPSFLGKKRVVISEIFSKIRYLFDPIHFFIFQTSNSVCRTKPHCIL